MSPALAELLFDVLADFHGARQRLIVALRDHGESVTEIARVVNVDEPMLASLLAKLDERKRPGTVPFSAYARRATR